MLRPVLVSGVWNDYTHIGVEDGTSLYLSDLISNGCILDADDAKSTAQLITVHGTIIFDEAYTFASGSEIAILNEDEDIGLVIDANIEFNDTYIHGCTHMWDGFEILADGVLNLENGTVVEDGIDAVWLTEDGAGLNVSDAEIKAYAFDAIRIGNTSQSNTGWKVTVSIEGLTVKGNETLLSPYATNDSGPAIFIVGVDDVSIGSSTGATNTIEKMYADQAVILENTSATIKNTKILDALGFTSQSAITFVGSGGNHNLEFVGLGETQAVISDFRIGINLIDGSLDITSANFDDLTWGIIVENNALKRSVEIEGNFFNTTGRGITISNALPATNLKIIDNEFDNVGTAINVSSDFKANAGNLEITDNIIDNTSSTSNQTAITLRSLEGGLVEDNTIDLNNTTTQFMH